MDFYNLILNGNISGLQSLISSGWNVNEYAANGSTALCEAAKFGQIQMVEELLQVGADINLSQNDDLGYTPLIQAVKNKQNSIDMIRFLVEQGANLEKGDSRNGTPLLHACIAGDNETLLYLVKKGANVDCTDSEGFTPLLYICEFAMQWDSQSITPLVNAVTGEAPRRLDDHFEILQTLIQHNADVNYKTPQKGDTPLHYAASKKEFMFIRPLVEAGANVNLGNMNNYMPLHAAADLGDFKSANELLKLGADVNAKDRFGFTPLIGAIMSGNKSVVNLLKDFGADRLAKVSEAYNFVAVGDTALDVAKKMNRQDLVEALLE